MSIVDEFNYGLECANNADYTSALIQFSKVIKENPFTHEAWYNRGKCKDCLGDMEGAVLDFKQCLIIEPNYESAYSLITVCFYDLNKDDECIKYYSQAINHFPENPSFYQGRALVKLRQSDFIGAKVDLLVANKLGLDVADLLKIAENNLSTKL